jgi:hypothetical protein
MRPRAPARSDSPATRRPAVLRQLHGRARAVVIRKHPQAQHDLSLLVDAIDLLRLAPRLRQRRQQQPRQYADDRDDHQ